MDDCIDAHREVSEKALWVELDPPPVCPKNGKAMTYGRALPNGEGLTSGSGMINGTALTSQTPKEDTRRRPVGFHIYPEEVTRRWEEWLPRGLGVRRDLINGHSIEGVMRSPVDPPRYRFWAKQKRNWKRRMEELADSPPPGNDTD